MSEFFWILMIFFIISVGTSALTDTFTPEMFEAATKTCERNDGLMLLDLEIFPKYSVDVYCNDGAEFHGVEFSIPEENENGR